MSLNLKRGLLYISIILFLISCKDKTPTISSLNESVINEPFNDRSLDNISIKNYRIDNGLSADLSKKILVDKKGFVWVATEDGLNRYDGSSFKKIKTDPDRVDSLSNNQLTTIFEDSKGYIWIGTYGGGLELFDRDNNRFRHFKNDISGDYIMSVNQSSNGLIWVGTEDNGIYSYDREKHLWSNYKLPSSCVLSIFEDSKENLWVGTKNGLSIFDKDKQQFKQILPGYQVNDIKESNDNLWIATNTKGLIRFNISTLEIESNIIKDRSILSLFIDTTGLLWVGTESGIEVFNIYKDEFVNFKYDINSPVYSITQDTATGIWFSTNVGVFRVERRTKSFNSYNEIKNVTALYTDNLDKLWAFNKTGDIHFYDSKTEKWSLWKKEYFNRKVLSVKFDNQNRLWVGTDKGLFLYYDLSKDSKPGLFLNNYVINSIKSDATGMLWVATENGLFYFDKNNSGFVEVDLDNNRVNSIFIDSTNNLWIGTKGGGVYVYNKDSKNLKKVVIDSKLNKNTNSNNILTIYEDRFGIIWIGTRGGLIRFDKSTKIFKIFSESSGLTNNIVKTIAEDNSGNLWISTNIGLSKFSPENESFENYNRFDGLSGDIFNANSAIKIPRGDMFFGGENGISYFNPNDDFRNNYVPQIYFTSFSQSGIPLIFDKAIEDLNLITLKWPKNSIEFTFTSLNYYQSNHNYYAYKLDGYDNYWNYTDKIPSGQYSNLPGGRYILRVKGSNNDGIWNSLGATITLVVYPPFWESWWFKMLLIVFIICLTLIIFKLKVNSTTKKAIILENEVKRQTDKRVLIENELAVISERTRLARDLHDSVTQTLFSANIISEVLPELWSKNRDKAAEKTRLVTKLTSGALAEMRTLLRELKPSSITEVPMSDLLKQLGTIVEAQSGIHVTVKTEEKIKLLSNIQIVFYRITQEALNNVVKHSDSSEASIIFKSYKDDVYLKITDNGVGFDTSIHKSGHFGIENMKSRAMEDGVKLNITSTSGIGTIIEIMWRG